MAEQDEGPIRQLTTLAKYADRLPEIIEAGKAIPPGLNLREVTTNIPSSIGVSELELRSVFLALDQLRLATENLGSFGKAFDRLSQFYGRDKLTTVAEKRDVIEKAVKLFTGDHPASISLKARRLTYARENLLQDIELVTDPRPVYNQSGSAVVEWIITHSLIVTYLHNGEPTRMLFTVDATDIEKMREQCSRAIIKAQTLKKTLPEPARIVTADNA